MWQRLSLRGRINLLLALVLALGLAVNVMRLEEVLRQLETFGGLLRDPDKYYVSVFGTPALTL